MMMVRHVMAPVLVLVCCGVGLADRTGVEVADREPLRDSYREHQLAESVSRVEESHAALVREAGDWTAELTVDGENAIVTMAVLKRGGGAAPLPRGPQRAVVEVAGGDAFGEAIEIELLPVLPAQEAATDYALFVGRHEALLGVDAFALTVVLRGSEVTEWVRFNVGTGFVDGPLVGEKGAGADFAIKQER